MAITNRFPQRLGNLAQNARFPHFHKPPVVVSDRRKDGKNEELSGVTNLSTESDQAQSSVINRNLSAQTRGQYLGFILGMTAVIGGIGLITDTIIRGISAILFRWKEKSA